MRKSKDSENLKNVKNRGSSERWSRIVKGTGWSRRPKIKSRGNISRESSSKRWRDSSSSRQLRRGQGLYSKRLRLRKLLRDSYSLNKKGRFR